MIIWKHYTAVAKLSTAVCSEQLVSWARGVVGYHARLASVFARGVRFDPGRVQLDFVPELTSRRR